MRWEEEGCAWTSPVKTWKGGCAENLMLQAICSKGGSVISKYILLQTSCRSSDVQHLNGTFCVPAGGLDRKPPLPPATTTGYAAPSVSEATLSLQGYADELLKNAMPPLPQASFRLEQLIHVLCTSNSPRADTSAVSHWLLCCSTALALAIHFPMLSFASQL